MRADKIIELIEKSEDGDIPRIAAEALAQLVDRLAGGEADFTALFRAIESRLSADDREELKAQLIDWVQS